MESEARYGVSAICEAPKDTMKVKIKKLHPDAVIPTKATPQSIGYDLYVKQDICIEHTRQVTPLGIAIELPDCIEAKIEPRSGFSSKGIEGFALKQGSAIEYGGSVVRMTDHPEDELWRRINKAERFNADVLVGKIDPDYRGEVGVIIRNNEPGKPFLIAKGTRIAQMTFYQTLSPLLESVEELSDTDRGTGGYGSTGV